MAITPHLNICIFPMIILASILLSMHKNTIHTTENRLFERVLALTFVILLTELISWVINGLFFPYARICIWATNLIYFAIIPLLAIFWMDYICVFYQKKSIFKASLRTKIFMSAPSVFYYLILFSTPYTGFIFTITDNNIYQRGRVYYIAYILNVLYVFATLIVEIYMIKNEKLRFRRKQKVLICLFTAFPIAAGVLQALMPQIWVLYPCVALSELLVYIDLQKKDITTDALTGINNRGSFNTYIKTQYEQKNTDKCLFILDLDRFKVINDKFGHDVGDRALVQTAEILSAFFHKYDAFIARYGGDEFCAVCHCAGKSEAVSIIHQIQREFNKYNSTHNNPYELVCSIGFKKIDTESESAIEEIIRQADSMMYENKRRGRKI